MHFRFRNRKLSQKKEFFDDDAGSREFGVKVKKKCTVKSCVMIIQNIILIYNRFIRIDHDLVAGQIHIHSGLCLYIYQI